MRVALLSLVALAFVITIVLYPRLPDPMPTHFDVNGNVDGWGAKSFAAFLPPVIMVAIMLLFQALPSMSPRGWEISPDSRAYQAVWAATIVFMFVVHLIVMAASLGRKVDISVIMPVAAGALFVVIGNYLSKVPRNFFIGVRTPWTLANDDVWFRTHRLASRTMMLAGIVVMATVPFLRGTAATAMLITALSVAALVPVVYSYVIYRRADRAADRG